MKPLKLKLWNEGNVVKMQVLEQDDSVRGRSLEKLAEFQGLKLISDTAPEMSTYTVFIRGTNRSMDNNIATLHFHMSSDAMEYIRKVEALVEVYNKSIEQNLPTTNHAEYGDRGKKKRFDEFANKCIEAEVQQQFKSQFSELLSNTDDLKGSVITTVESLELSHSTEITIYLEKDNIESKIVLYLNNDKKLG